MIMRIILKVFAEIYLGLDFAFLGVNMWITIVPLALCGVRLEILGLTRSLERISIERIGFFQLDNVDFPVGTLCDD